MIKRTDQQIYQPVFEDFKAKNKGCELTGFGVCLSGIQLTYIDEKGHWQQAWYSHAKASKLIKSYN